MTADAPTRGQHLVAADQRFLLGGGWFGALARGQVERVLARIDKGLATGSLDATLPDGRQVRLGGRAVGAAATIVLPNWRPVVRLALSGSAGFARAYFDGDWSSSDPVAIFELFVANRATLGDTARAGGVARLVNRAVHALQANSRTGSRRNISFHYDLGNDFYAAWLDPGLTYSSAIWAEGDDLEAAQTRKVRRLLDSLDLKPGERLLEIGCGWGGLAEIAARDYGAVVHGITLSAEQLSYAQARIAAAGLADRASFALCDYRDVSGSYDHIVSVEMFEAVGERHWPDFMGVLARILRPGGRAALQVITIDEAIFAAYRASADFIQTYIFPGGMLPSLERLRGAAEAAGLGWQGVTHHGLDYARTLAEWRERFDAAVAGHRLPPGFDERFVAIWRYYLMYCEGGFRGGGLDVVQALLVKT
ncbi:class I SAM-dependent methyltransferase [Glacieibacterium sp.]|uniref:class I SAM-dependent methyltransferase n=1 Tax=Glacieibacterium sp. TaxID=2860237 RepID=UPI003B004E5A